MIKSTQLFAIIFFSVTVGRAQPANDNLCNAIMINVGASCELPNIDLEMATAQENEPFIYCSSDSQIDTVVYNSVWYSFVAPAEDIAIIAVTDTFDFLKDFQINLFELSESCEDLSSLKNIDCSIPINDDGVIMTPNLSEGIAYYMQVSGKRYQQDSINFSGKGCLTITTITPPINDDPCGAIPLDLENPAQIFSNLGATVPESEFFITPPVSSRFAGLDGWSAFNDTIDNSVWFTFRTPPDGGNVLIDLSNSFELPGNFNAQVAVYQVEDCSDFSTFSLLTAADIGFLENRIIENPVFMMECLEGNKTYYLLVDGASSSFGRPTRDKGYFSIQTSLARPAPSVGTIGPATELDSVCVDDGLPDVFAVDSEGGFGFDYEWIFTDTNLNITSLPGAPPFNFEGQDAGTALVWLIYFDNIMGLETNANLNDLQGCYALSDFFEVSKITGDACASLLTTTNDHWSEIDVSVSPNPVSDLLRIKTDFFPDQESMLVIRDLHGRVLISQYFHSTEQRIDVSSLPEGHYFLEVRNKQKNAFKQFIKL
ncbi:T9SS type A sorting domain-containing protein [Flavilitoribacter nigricans]|uniref:Secretion system C-terminal sorting domain-containing protein n=1 Tax=Flavilitoribacter nigricans (strain ATCC 23147 / DSM 23189 / NBRC 102662 / NCIMB 1420 / SS-2) TaxID=1122177 RepID=A0A2D0MYD2_FLAN2|nr:T9SS type A sorting domain-containing protein [Flavilitoribacter nigricans]PHN00889.1 hypothetical protein CRP01_39815 [Flavilitoribacter nigricans DSM 23189 = NBRC 102662]